MRDLVLICGYGLFMVFFGYYLAKEDAKGHIEYLKEQITLRDSVNTQNIRIHKLDSIERRHLFNLLPK